MRPLADEIRPQTLDEVAGQKHLLGEGALLRLSLIHISEPTRPY